ncbi:MAG TPA: TolC family protein [Salinivirgaceae bacterium]|nr:TolC family protein [Salinivirgaceae bacterium]
MNRYCFIIFLLIIVTGQPLASQQVITLEEARKMALEVNPTANIAMKNVEKADAERKTALSFYLPTISGTATMAYFENGIKEDLFLPVYKPDVSSGQLVPDFFYHPITGLPIYDESGNPIFKSYAYLPLEISLKGAYMAGIQIQQPIYTGGKIAAANRMAKIGQQLAEENLLLQKLQLIYEVDQAYWLLLSVEGKVKLAATAVSMLDSLREKVSNAVKVGLVHHSDLLKVNVEYNQALYDLQKAKSGREMARMALCQMVGLPLNTNLILADSIIQIEQNILHQFDNESIEQRPEHRILSGLVALEEQNIRLEQSKYLPNFGIAAGYSKIGNIDLGPKTLGSQGFNAMATLNIPLFHWGEGRNKIKSAKLSKEIKQLEKENATQLMQLELEQTKKDLQDAWVKIQYTQTALDEASKNLELSKQRYQLGQEHVTDLLLSQTQWQKASTNLIEAKIEFKIRETAYMKASGKLQFPQ